MARKAIIPILDHNTDGVCSLYYTVRYKLRANASWTTLNQQQPQLYGSPAQYCFILDALVDNTDYDVEITRHCCEGVNSTPVTTSFDSGS